MEIQELYKAMLEGFQALNNRIDGIDEKFTEKFNVLEREVNALKKNVNNLNKVVGGLSNNLGFETEDSANEFLKNSIKKKESIGGYIFDSFKKNHTMRNIVKNTNEKKDLNSEIDNILINGSTLGIVETKTVLDPKKVRDFLDKNLKEFEKLEEFSGYKNKKVKVKDKKIVLGFMCKFIKEDSKIKKILKDSGYPFFIYKEKPYGDFIEIK